jgi:hypothetical protein
MEIETLEANFYRDRAHLCHKLANAATEAKPLFRRLYFLAKAYEGKARAADSGLEKECAIPPAAID